jgi:hypothetical protein
VFGHGASEFAERQNRRTTTVSEATLGCVATPNARTRGSLLPPGRLLRIAKTIRNASATCGEDPDRDASAQRGTQAPPRAPTANIPPADIPPGSRGRRRLGQLIEATSAGTRWRRLASCLPQTFQDPPPAPGVPSPTPWWHSALMRTHADPRRESSLTQKNPI